MVDSRIKSKKPGLINRIKFKIGKTIIGLGTGLLGTHMIDIVDNQLKIINATRVHEPVTGYVISSPSGEAQLIKTDTVLTHLGQNAGLMYGSLGQGFHPSFIAAVSELEESEKDITEIDYVPADEGPKAIDPSHVQSYEPASIDVNSMRRMQGDAEEAAKNMVKDDSSKLADVAERIAYVFIGGILVYLATSNSGGGSGSGNGGLGGDGIVPTPGTIDATGLMDGLVALAGSVDPTLILALAGLA